MGNTVIVSAIEDKIEEATVEILDELEERDNVQEPGSDIKLNSMMVTKETTITSIRDETGMLAAASIREVPIYYTPRVGMVSASDEVTRPYFIDCTIASSNLIHPDRSGRPSYIS